MPVVRRRSLAVVLCLFFGFAVFAPFHADAAPIRRATEPVKDRYIVTVAPPFTANVDSVATRIAAEYDGKLLAIWKHAVKGFWIELAPHKAARLGADSRVERVARDVELEASAEQKTGRRDLPPNLPEVTLRPCYDVGNPANSKPDPDPLWHLTRLSHRTMQYDADCNPMPAPGESLEDFHSFRYWSDGSWPRGTSTSRVKVYLVDTGVWRDHAEFADATVTDGFNAAANPDSPARVPLREPAAVDPSSSVAPCSPGGLPGGTNAAHGTGTASFVVGKYIGVAKGVELVSVKAVSCKNNIAELTVAMLISSLDHVKSVAQPPAVVSVSTFRSVPPSAACDNPTNCASGMELQILEDAFNGIIDAGVPVFASANNQKGEACLNTPARLSMRGARRVTGDPPEPIGVITVGGTDRADNRWISSNYGQCVDIFAPAAGLIVAYPPGSSDNPGPFASTAQAQSGTSYSAPMVASIAARMMAEDLSIWQGRTGHAIVREVWQRLKVNATPLPAALDPVPSPRLLAYLGGVMFLSQPVSTTVPAGSTFDLSVSIHDPDGVLHEYEWYRERHVDGAVLRTRVTNGGKYSGAGLAKLTIADADESTVGEYWVRVIRYDNNIKYYADSTRATVAIGTCPIPTITRQPLSRWDVAGGATVTLRADVSTSTTVRYEWQRIEVGENSQTRQVEERIVESWSGTTGSASLEQNVTAPDNVLFTQRVYRLVLTPIDSCGTWRVESDSAQVRTCVRPATPTLKGPVNGEISFSGAGLTTDVGQSKPRARWYYSATQNGPFEVFRLTDLSEKEKSLNGGAEWAILSGVRAFPVKPGWYKVALLGACGESDLSNAVQVVSGCSFKLEGKYEDSDTTFGAELGVMKYEHGSTPRLSIQAKGDLNDFRPEVQFTWKKGDTIVSTAEAYTAEPVTGPVQYVVTATTPERAGRTSCSLTFTFNLDVKETRCPAGTNLAVVAGKCQRTAGTILRPYQGSKHLLTAAATLNGNAASAELTFKWSVVVGTAVTPLPNGEGKGLDAYEYIVAEGRPHIVRVTVTDGTCTARSDIAIYPVLPACNLCVTPCKRRSVRHNGVEKTLHQFVAGEQGLLSAPEERPGYTYEWHQLVSGANDVVVGTTPSIDVTFEHTSDFYVVTNTGAEREISDNFKAVLDNRTSTEAEATPSLHAVLGGQTVTFTAGLTNEVEDATTRYEWRQASTYGDWHPVAHSGKRLIVTAIDDTVYWCRIRKVDPATGQEKYWDTNFVSLVVLCTDSIAGTVSANPSRVARNQRPRLAGFAIGKNVAYSWVRTLPNDPTPVPASTSGSGVVYPIVTEPVTYFRARATDACGQSADLGQVDIYLCVPTIDVPPQNRLELPGTPVTLTVAATPAVDGQTFQVKWYRANDTYLQTPLGEGTSFTTTLPAGTNIDSFLAAITSDCGGSPNTIKSAPATIEYCSYPVIHSYTPTDYITSPGGWAQFSIAATGKDLTYQWYLGEAGNTSTPLTGKTQSFLDVAPNTTTNYWCRVKSQNLCPTDTGTVVAKVCNTPTIVTGPQGNRIFPGKTASLSVIADKGPNTDPLVYQWQKETSTDQWTDIAGATLPSYTTPALSAETNYRVKVSAGICEIISDPATISMCALPESVSGSEYKVELNGSATLTLPALSPVVSKNVTWYRGEAGDIGTPVRSGVNASYTTPALTATTKYWAEFEYEGCVSRTTTYTVNVCKPTINTQPVNTTIQSGSSTPLSIATTNMPGETIQWYAGSVGTTTTSAGTGATINVNPTSTTTYWARVTSCGLNADSIAVTVTVCTPPNPTLVTPSPRSIKSGQTTSLQTYAPGSNITYQWYSGSSGVTTNPVAGQTTDWLQVSPATNTDYWCKVTSYGTCVTNGPTITVDVCENPTISVQPLSQRVFSGAATTLSVTATSSRPLTYQWYRGTAGDTLNPISGATSPSVTLSPTTETSYWVRVINGVCSTDSATATISMCAFDPTYSGSEIKIGYNETATLSLPALSPVVSKNVTWYRGDAGDFNTPVRSGVNVSYTTPALTATTKYWAEFEYEGCVSRTTTYTVNVCKPAITTQPVNATIQSGGSTPLTIATTNIPGQTITWYVGAVGTTTTSAGTGASINVNPTSTTTYWARVSSCGLNADSVAVTVTVCTPPNPTIVTPSPRYIKSGQTTSLQTYAPGSNLTYQWYTGSSGVTSSPVAGQTTDWLQVSPTTNTNYWCKITSYGTCVTNGPTITVDVCENPTITGQPLSSRVFSGTATTLSVTATSSRPLSYQWYRGTTGDTTNPISGATSASVTVSPTTETSYWVRVINGVCSTDSATATVSMCAFDPTYGGSEVKIGYNETATLSLPTLSPVVNKNVWWYRGAAGVKTDLVSSGVNVSYTTPALTTTTTYWAEFEYQGCYSRTTAYTVNVCKPSVTTQPTNRSIASGQSATLSITTTPIAGQTIQWYSGAVGTTTSPVPNGTGTSVVVSPTATTSYWARVSSCGLTADSTAATVSVCTAPTISIVTPSPRYIKSGQTTSLQTYSSSPNLTYQWYVGTSGTTTSPVGTSSDWLQVSPTTTTSYWCKVTSNGTCVTNGPTITVDVCNLPAISAQPQSQRIFSGKSAALTVTASSPTHSLAYQWYRGVTGDTSSPISGATSSSMSVAPTTDTNYWVRVTTSGGACFIDSNTATVSMCTYPEVVPGASYNIASGQSVTLNLPAMSPVDGKNVVWYRGSVGVKTTPVASGVNVGYTTPPLTATTQYWAEFEHAGCYSRTEAYTVNVCVPTITAQPQSQVIFSGQTAALSVTATGAPLSYQWYRGSTGDVSQPVGTNSNSYTTPALTAAASYWVRITGCTTADSATATVTVCTAPSISSITKDPWTSIGGAGSITVSAGGTNLSYQWYMGQSGDTSRPITGATAATYNFTRQTSEYLWVRVRSSCNNGSVDSVATMYSVDPRITHEPQSVTVPTGTSATFSVTATGTYLSYQWHSQTTGLIPGATANVFTTPALTQESSYYCKVTSGTNGYDYSSWATAFVCQGPGVSSVTATQINATTWKLVANVNWWEEPETKYYWYKGPIGNTTQSTFLGEAGSTNYFYNVTTSTTFWVRAQWLDDSCYTDGGKTVP